MCGHVRIPAQQNDRVAERANYVIVDGGAIELYYARSGACDLDLDLVAGPDAALRQIRRRGRPTDHLLDRVWCEAAAFIDPGRRVLAIFTWHCEGYAHRAALRAVLAETWPGWDIRWAYGGIEEIATQVGRPVQPYDRSGSRPSLAAVDPADPAELDECNLLVTVVEPDRSSRAYAMWTDVNDAFWSGPAMPAMLPESALVTELPRLPESGLHLDPSARTAAIWTTLELAGLARDWPRHWPGWRCEFHQDSYETQLAACAGQLRVPEPDPGVGLDTLARRVTFTPHDRYGSTFGGSREEFEAAHAAIARVRARPYDSPRWPGFS